VSVLARPEPHILEEALLRAVTRRKSHMNISARAANHRRSPEPDHVAVVLDVRQVFEVRTGSYVFEITTGVSSCKSFMASHCDISLPLLGVVEARGP